jgi:hypothetical protein
MAKRRRDKDARRRAHIDRAERVFLPEERMRQIRWEESVAHSQAKQRGIEEYKLVHMDCHCGSVECLGVPIVVPLPGDPKPPSE